MIGVGPQASRGRSPASRRRAVARRAEADATAITGAAETAARAFTKDRRSLAGAVAIGRHHRVRPTRVPSRFLRKSAELSALRDVAANDAVEEGA